MGLIEILRAIYINISTNKFKVFLTSLGIIVGAFTITMVVGIGKGGEADVQDQFKRLNVGTINIMSGKSNMSAIASQESLTPSDVEDIMENCPSVSDVTISITGKPEVTYHDVATSVTVAGVTENYQQMSNLTVEYGTFITDHDNEKKNKVVVLGSDIADLLFESEKADAVGMEITINGRKFQVVGILERMGDSMQGFNPDEGMIIPYQTAEKYVVGKNTKPSIMALAKDVDHVSSAIEEIKAVLNQNHKKSEEAFMVKDAGSRLTAAQDSAKSMAILLTAVATVVLIVGGIGIMNVLLVSVKERTREIGILKAIGTRKRDILLQFLLESIMISTMGGIIGILLSMMTIPLMKYIELRVIPSLFGYVLALGFSVATGTFFGYYPAMKAASLKPIDALNHE